MQGLGTHVTIPAEQAVERDRTAVAEQGHHGVGPAEFDLLAQTVAGAMARGAAGVLDQRRQLRNGLLVSCTSRALQYDHATLANNAERMTEAIE